MLRRELTKTAYAVTPFLLLAMLFLGGIYYVLLFSINRVIQDDAGFAASHWSAYLADHPTEIPRLRKGRGLSQPALTYYRTLAASENIVGFALRGADGALQFETTTRTLNEKSHVPGPNRSPTEGLHRSDLSLVSSIQPIQTIGKALAYVEVVSDQGARWALFEGELLRAFAALAFLTACSFGVPAFVFLRERAQKERGEKRIEFLAQHDLMTGLMNMSSFNRALAKQLDQLPTGEQIALHFIDLDRFKSVNDSLGHSTGDELIASVAARLEKVRGSKDLLARFGGDEFVLAQADVRKLDDAEQCGRLIRLAVAAPLTAGAHQITTTVSVGTAIFPQHGVNVAEMTKAADLALYTAKNDGRDTCRIYHPDMDVAHQVRQKIEKALRRAVAAESFELHFQPIVRAEEKKLLGFEVLLRLDSETGEEIPPTSFIPVAEEMGLISQIGSWVIKQACKAAVGWPDYLTVSVNMSPRQFENGELCAIVAGSLHESGLAPHRLELEITEGLLMADTEGVMTQLRQLKALGVSIAMDDFGTGYSSLSYLWRFPFDKLKIDRSFMDVLAEGDEHVGNILNTIVSLGRTLNLQVTAEGVETQEQADFLKSLNCDQLQGYHFGRPMPESDIAAVILKDGLELAASARKDPFADDMRQFA